MKKLESNFINMALVLTTICVLAALLLSAFFSLTKSEIEQSAKEKQTAAISEVLPMENAQLKSEVIVLDEKEYTIYNAFVGEDYVGTAVESSSNSGFNGLVRVMVGFAPDGKILNYAVLEQKETPGLGTKMEEWFKPQQEITPSLVERIFGFEVKKLQRESSIVGHMMQGNLAVRNDGGTIDAITAATISSRAFLNAVNSAYSVFLKASPLQQKKEQVMCDSIVTVQDSLSCDSVQKEEKLEFVTEEKNVVKKVQKTEVKVVTTPSQSFEEVDAIGSATQLQDTNKNSIIENTKISSQIDSICVDTNKHVLMYDSVQLKTK